MEEAPTYVQISFISSGEKYEMVFSDGIDDLTFRPIENIDLDPYKGSYYSEELDTYYHIEPKEDYLLVHHQRLPDIKLYPISENTFHSKTWFMKNIQFVRSENSEVSGFGVFTRGVTNLQFEKQ